MKNILVFCLLLLASNFAVAQPNKEKDVNEEDAFYIKKIYETILGQGQAYEWLKHLTGEIGGRLAGSPESVKAVDYTYAMMDSMGMDKVWKQPCTVNYWSRGPKKEKCIVRSKTKGKIKLNATALGGSVGTPKKGIKGEVIEVQSIDEMDELGREKIEGKIVFFNRPMDPTLLDAFAAYSGASSQRTHGPERAARLGAIGAIVRSLTLRLDDVPHTGVTIYPPEVKNPIVGMAISTMDANMLSDLLKKEKGVKIYMRADCKPAGPRPSFNVIGEIKGSEFPDEIILVGGHLDSWDIAKGAHDDGTGCVQSLEVIHVMKRMGYKPKRTIRCVMFMNEENGQAGAKAYQKESDEKGEKHIAAIESDKGGFTPRGFTADGEQDIFLDKFLKVAAWQPLLAPYGLNFKKGGSGADIYRLKPQKGLVFGFWPDSQRYFDYHHAENDGIHAVNKRELEMGAAAMASLVYLIDKYGL